MHLYYSKVQVKNAHLLAHNGPRIIIANHPNTLVDAWLISDICKEPVYFMTKGTFFDNKLKMWLLRSLNLIPINRSTEAKTKGVSNTATFEECYTLLESGKTLVIYPEGNSQMERKLRQLKSGAARIALEVENRNEGKLNLKVFPMGLIYLQAEKFRSSILVNVGKGLPVQHHLEEFSQNGILASRKLTKEFRKGLEKVLVTTQNEEQEQVIENIVSQLQSRYRKEYSGVEGEVILLKKVRDRVEEFSLYKPKRMERIQKMVNHLEWQVEKLNIRADFLDRRFRSRMFIRQIIVSILFVIIGFPLFIFGLIHNILPYSLTNFLMPRLVKNVEYFAPVAILLGLVLYPINYFAFVKLTDFLLNIGFAWKSLYFLAMPITGMAAYYYGKYLTHISYKWNYIFLMMNHREALRELKQKREKLFDVIFKK